MTMTYKVVMQLSSSDYGLHKAMLDQIVNLLNNLDDLQIEVVIHGQAYPFLLENSLFNLHVQDLKEKNVHFLICKNTMHAHNLILNDLIQGVSIVQSGVAHLVKRQTEGWAYLKASY